jgi:sulfate permease, SulP family
VGLYASIVPVALYGLLGSSRTLAVGPVAIVSLLVATALTPLAEPGSVDYVQLAMVLALLSGLIQAVMGLARLGFLVNFLSHPVLSGFTNGAALVIGLSQVRHLLGVSLPASENFVGAAWYTAVAIPQSNLTTLAIGLGSVACCSTSNTDLQTNWPPGAWPKTGACLWPKVRHWSSFCWGRCWSGCWG